MWDKWKLNQIDSKKRRSLVNNSQSEETRNNKAFVDLFAVFSGRDNLSRKLATILTSSTSRFASRPTHETPTLDFLFRFSYSLSKKPPLPLLIRALSTSAAVQISSATKSSTTKTPDNNGGKPQWKVAIDFKWIRDNKEYVGVNMKNRNSNNGNLELVLELYEKMPNLQKEVERIPGERNIVANKMKEKKWKERLIALEEDLVKLTDELQREAQCIPNMIHPDVPVRGEDSSTVRKMVGSPRKFSFPVKDHLQLGKEPDLFDFDAAAKVSGSKFYYLKNEAVLLEMGLVNWTLRINEERLYSINNS